MSKFSSEKEAIAKQWLQDNFSEEQLSSIMDECNGFPLMMDLKQVASIAVATGVEPLELLSKHYLGHYQNITIAELQDICYQYNGATLGTFHYQEA